MGREREREKKEREERELKRRLKKKKRSKSRIVQVVSGSDDDESLARSEFEHYLSFLPSPHLRLAGLVGLQDVLEHAGVGL